jgi:hypothetical protein
MKIMPILTFAFGLPAAPANAAVLTTSLGPGTTEAADEVDESIVSTDVPGVQLITAFKGLTLGPGTYHLVYRVAQGSVFGDNLQPTFNAVHPLLAGPGVTGGFHQFEDGLCARVCRFHLTSWGVSAEAKFGL